MKTLSAFAVLITAMSLVFAFGCASTPVAAPVSDQAPVATEQGFGIRWIEHRVDDELINGGVGIRGGDGLKLADIDGDGFVDIVSVHEDSHHLRIAFGSGDPTIWHNITVASGAAVGAIEDVAIADLNGDGKPDLVAACENAHLVYFQNPADARVDTWPHLIPPVASGRGSWIQVDAADLDGDGQPEVLGANKGFDDVVRRDVAVDLATSIFSINGDPLEAASWHETELLRSGVPNQVLAEDVDGDGDLDVLAAGRLKQTMTLLVNEGELNFEAKPIRITPGFAAGDGVVAVSNAFNAGFADIDSDGRLDLVVNLLEFSEQPGPGATWQHAGLGWLRQPDSLDRPWTYYRIGTLLPDWAIGFGLADIDGDGDVDAIAGGYSGLNVLKGGYSGASRTIDDPAVTADDSVARIAWFENRGIADPWFRHDISRRVRGMFDEFIAADMDADGDIDFVATRGNSGEYDGVFWLEQVRSDEDAPVMTYARENESRLLPLAPEDWRSRYTREIEYVAPNKDEQMDALSGERN